MSQPVFVIVEAGVNHNGQIEIAKQLIKEAKSVGANAIKFQTFKADKLVTATAQKADYQQVTTDQNQSQYEMLKSLELSEKDHRILKTHCQELDILFLSTPFDEDSADFLESLNLPLFKISSGDLTNHPFLAHLAKKKKPMILSTGMSTLGDVDAALNVIAENGNPEVSLLHCVTEYPAPYDQINLKAMQTLRQAFQVPVGYSDHTLGIEISLAAVALGASIIEKHLTLDKTMAGPDHRASLEPQEFKKMVESIRHIEQALGDGIKKPAECELRNMSVARKSLVVARPIKKGERFTKENVAIKRPGTGLSPSLWDYVLGSTATHDYSTDDLIQWKSPHL